MAKGLPRSLAHANKAQAPINKMKISVNHPVSSLATSTAIGFGSVVIGDFPEGNILLLGAVATLKFTGPTSANLVDTWEGDFGVGSTPASDATISGADEDIIPETALAAATAEVSPTTRAFLAAPAVLDNTAGALEINLNVLVDAADITDDETVTLTVTGDLVLSYQVLSDD